MIENFYNCTKHWSTEQPLDIAIKFGICHAFMGNFEMAEKMFANMFVLHFIRE